MTIVNTVITVFIIIILLPLLITTAFMAWEYMALTLIHYYKFHTDEEYRKFIELGDDNDNDEEM